MRKITEFIIWNHVFFVCEVIYSIFIREYILAFLGSLTTYLSIERHRYMDAKYPIIEPIVAKTTMIYITLMGLYHFSIYQRMILIISEIITLLVYYIERYDYTLIHPWLHITVAHNIYIYIIYIK